MQKYFVTFLHLLTTWAFFLSISSISGFSCFKNIFIYACKKTGIKSSVSYRSEGGFKALADADAENASSFFDVLPYSSQLINFAHHIIMYKRNTKNINHKGSGQDDLRSHTNPGPFIG